MYTTPKLHPVLGARLVANKVSPVLVCNLLMFALFLAPIRAGHLICCIALLLSNEIDFAPIMAPSWAPICMHATTSVCPICPQNLIQVRRHVGLMNILLRSNIEHGQCTDGSLV
jgi:hypothetical protein